MIRPIAQWHRSDLGQYKYRSSLQNALCLIMYDPNKNKHNFTRVAHVWTPKVAQAVASPVQKQCFKSSDDIRDCGTTYKIWKMRNCHASWLRVASNALTKLNESQYTCSSVASTKLRPCICKGPWLGELVARLLIWELHQHINLYE